MTGEWLTAKEIAALRLPGLPRSMRRVSIYAVENGWRVAMDDLGNPLARQVGSRRRWEYHVALLPVQPAKSANPVTGDTSDTNDTGDTYTSDIGTGDDGAGPATAAEAEAQEAWAWYDRQSATCKAEAERRMNLLLEVEALITGGASVSQANASVAATHGLGTRTLFRWQKQVKGLPRSDRLPALAPRRANSGRHQATLSNELWLQITSDYLQFSRPSFASCYRRAEAVAAAKGEKLPTCRALLFRLEREFSPQLIMLRRYGEKALRRMMPPQQHSVAELEALEIVNIGGHRANVFVEWPDGRIARPMIIAIQDVYSRKMLSYRIAKNEDAHTARLAFGDLFKDFGIPRAVLSDKGRAFAAKTISGGAKTRFHFKIRDEDIQKLLTALGVERMWAQPHRGQSKPIKRAFRDLCDDIARGPACAGAYTGNSTENKPENYRSRAVPLAEFKEIFADGIAAHNARKGRKTEMALGKHSFDEVFAESYTRATIRKATAGQLRLAMMYADSVNVDRQTSAVNFMGNRYWTEQLSDFAGKKVTIRFDPDKLHSPIYVYTKDERFIAAAPILNASSFANVTAAKKRAKQEREFRQAAQNEGETLKAFPTPEIPKDHDIRKGSQRMVHMTHWTPGGNQQEALPYSFYIDIVTKRYFDGVDNKNLTQVLNCFAPDAILHEVTSDTLHNGRKAICAMFEKLFADFQDIWHGNFVHTADPNSNAICSQFTVLITPNGGEQIRYENCNRFYCKDRLFQHVFVYMSGDNLLLEGDA